MGQSSKKHTEVLLSLPKVYLKQIPVSVEVSYFKVKKDPHVHEHTYSVCKGLLLLMVTPRIPDAETFVLNFRAEKFRGVAVEPFTA